MVNSKMELLLVELRANLTLEQVQEQNAVQLATAEKLRLANKAKAEVILKTIKMGLARNNG